MRRIMLLFLASGLIMACSSQAIRSTKVSSPVINSIIPTQTSLVSVHDQSGTFEVIARPNPSDGLKTDIYLRNISGNEEKLLITLEDVYRDHYHAGEYHNGNLYIIRRMGYPGENWADELWHYDIQGNGTKLFSKKGIDFRAASNEDYAAVGYQSTEDNANRIAFVRKNGEVRQELNVDATGNYLERPDRWSDDSRLFWGELELGPTPRTIFQIDISSWAIKKYDITQLNIGSEFELNANTGKIVYSDYPVFYEEESKQQFVNSGREVKLFLYDLNSQTSQIIATSITKQFSPKWLDNRSIEYNDPSSGARITLKIN